MKYISVYGSHNASISVAYDNKIQEVIEVERITNKKNAALFNYQPIRNKELVFNEILAYIKRKHGIVVFDICLYQECKGLHKLIPAESYEPCLHHRSHASGSFYQSDFAEAGIISFDGGGNDGYFKFYSANRKTGIKLIKSLQLDLGAPYGILGHFLSPIRREENIFTGNLVYAGKIMGLAAYGEDVPDWHESFIKYYKSNERLSNYKSRAQELFSSIGVLTNENDFLTDSDSKRVAATSQKVFEYLFFENTDWFIHNYENLILTGGCALNINLIERLRNVHSNVFVAPNSNDSGLSVGMILDKMKPQLAADITYLGSPVYDKSNLIEHLSSHVIEEIDFMRLARYLSKGYIIGLMQNGSEHGPRALGNRSILCSPLLEEMKNTLNTKVKNREYYRPFAPVCMFEYASEYFHTDKESRWMNAAVQVKEAYKSTLKSVTHEDGSSRLQTVTNDQNRFLYSLLVHFKHVSGFPILLNTSFNIAGKPLINRYSDALLMLNENKLHAVILGDRIFFKDSNESANY